MCTMKQACDMLGMTYETLRFYCDEGLVPNVKRNKNNYRDFDERNLKWLQSLMCLKRCGMSIADMKKYMHLCMEGKSSIPDRKEMLAKQKEFLLEEIKQIEESIKYIDNKQQYFDDIMDGTVPFTSNLIDVKQCGEQ